MRRLNFGLFWIMPLIVLSCVRLECCSVTPNKWIVKFFREKKSHMRIRQKAVDFPNLRGCIARLIECLNLPFLSTARALFMTSVCFSVGVHGTYLFWDMIRGFTSLMKFQKPFEPGALQGGFLETYLPDLGSFRLCLVFVLWGNNVSCVMANLAY